MRYERKCEWVFFSEHSVYEIATDSIDGKCHISCMITVLTACASTTRDLIKMCKYRYRKFCNKRLISNNLRSLKDALVGL